MAKIDLKFLDCSNHDGNTDYIKVEHIEGNEFDFIQITGIYYGRHYSIWLDKSTAIKFAKTLRTEINKIV
jgi:hypothetical protein